MNKELIALKDQGKLARALGKPFYANPFKNAENRPPQSGESWESWFAKYHAWEIGWMIEDTKREATP